METSQLNRFKKTLIKAYYYTVIVDGKVDPKELTFGSDMILKEGVKREDFDEMLDALSSVPREEVRFSLAEDIKQLPKDEQIKVMAYMSSLADADGDTDVSEKDIIHELCYKLGIDFKDIIHARQNLNN